VQGLLSAVAIGASFIFWLDQLALPLGRDLKLLFADNIWASLPDETMSCSLQSRRRLTLSRDTEEGASR
jgi:hypothetical protein